MKSTRSVGFLLSWFILCLAFLSVRQLNEFDPVSKLSNAITNIHYETELSAQLASQFGDMKRSAIHFSSSDCFCEMVAAKHIKNLTNQLSEQGFRNIHVDLGITPQFLDFIPSTPAVAIIGDRGEVIYLGPYSEGYGCLTGTGLVDNVKNKILSNELENTLLITEAKGCYCQV